MRSFSRRAHLREHQKAHEISQTVVDTTPNTSISNSISLNKTDFITLFDCQSCGHLFASEHDLKKHSCLPNVSADDITSSLKTKKSIKGKTNAKKTLGSAMATKSKPKPSNVNSHDATLTTAVLGDSEQMTPKDSSNSEFTFQFHDGLDDNIPTAHIEIITAPVDIGSSFPPIVTIDGIQYPTIPILTNSMEGDDDSDPNREEMSTKLLLTTTSISSLK